MEIRRFEPNPPESGERDTPPRGPWPLTDTVKPYSRHALVCTGVDAWSARLEEDGGLLGRLARDIRDLRDVLAPPPKLTATDEPTEGAGFDLLVFPEAIRYHNIDEGSWPPVLRDHLVRGRPSAAVRTTPLLGRYVFVCVHQARDERCGCWGPPVREAMEEACKAEGVDVTIRATSHVGGHKYAGNVVIYPDGVWYGYVRPGDAPRIARQHFGAGRIVEELWRGTMQQPG